MSSTMKVMAKNHFKGINKFKGVFTALITPFESGRVDFHSLGRLVGHQLENGISGFVVNGTTAESPTLMESEVKEIYHFVRSEVGPGFPVIVGTGSNSTQKTIVFTGKAMEWGADGALVVTPYYNRPTQQGLMEHFYQVASQCPFPICLYNVPGRTVVTIELETLVYLSRIENIVGVKEASGDMELGRQLIQSVDEWLILSGDDASCLKLIVQGGQGVISVLSHIIPRKMSEWVRRGMGGDSSVVEEGLKFSSLIHQLYIESNPIPVKMGLYKMGLIRSPELRLPMTRATEETTRGLVESMSQLKIIEKR